MSDPRQPSLFTPHHLDFGPEVVEAALSDTPEADAERAKRVRDYARRDCLDCGVDIYDIGEYYMVYDHVWRAAAGKDDREGVKLCLGCLSHRLGRRLYLEDFPPIPLNSRGRTAPAILHAVTGG